MVSAPPPPLPLLFQRKEEGNSDMEGRSNSSTFKIRPLEKANWGVGQALPAIQKRPLTCMG